MLAALGRVLRALQVSYYTRRLGRRCESSGAGVVARGPMRLRGPGKVILGEACFFDATKEAPIRLDVGYGAELSIGSGTYLNEGVQIVCNVGVTIGERCLIAPEVVILDDDGHPADWRKRHNHWPTTPETRIGAPIVIEDNVWLCQRAMVLKGVRIGAGSVVAAGAVVTRSVPAQVVVAGVPAEIVREL